MCVLWQLYSVWWVFFLYLFVFSMSKALHNQLNFLTGISQRDYTQYYDHISKQHEEICRSIQEFFKKHIQYKFLDEDCKYLQTSVRKGNIGRGGGCWWRVLRTFCTHSRKDLTNKNNLFVYLCACLLFIFLKGFFPLMLASK